MDDISKVYLGILIAAIVLAILGFNIVAKKGSHEATQFARLIIQSELEGVGVFTRKQIFKHEGTGLVNTSGNEKCCQLIRFHPKNLAENSGVSRYHRFKSVTGTTATGVHRYPRTVRDKTQYSGPLLLEQVLPRSNSY